MLSKSNGCTYTDFFASSELFDGEQATPTQGSAKSVDFLDELLRKVTAEPILPLWKVKFHLLACDVTYEPSTQEFQQALQKFLEQYEDVVSNFAPISEDPRIRPFLQHSQHDLLMILDDPPKPKEKLVPWPNIETLLHEFGPYQQCIAYIDKTVSATMKGVQKLTAVSYII